MAKHSPDTPPNAESLHTDQPAVAIRVSPDQRSDSVAGAILRAQRNGHHAFVVDDGQRGAEALEFAHQLGAGVIEPEANADNIEGIRNEVEHVARLNGFPGLIWQVDSTLEIAYDETTAELHERSTYSIDAIESTDSKGSANVVVGIPTYNEAVSIGSVVVGASQHADEVIVVDDGSTDNTAAVAEAAGATVLEHQRNRGKGAAIRSLFQYVRSIECEAVVLLDGDGQHDPSQIPEVVQPVLDDEASVVIGSRYLEQSNCDETPRYRRVGQHVLDLLLLGSSRRKVSDSQSGFRALSPTAVETITLNTDTFGVESEMLDAATQNGLEVTEQPIDVRYDGITGPSQNPFRHGLAVVMFILSLVRDRHPLLFFGVPGAILTVIGVLYGLEGILIYQATGTFFPAKVLVSGFLTILGTLGLFLGLLLSQMRNMIAEMET